MGYPRVRTIIVVSALVAASSMGLFASSAEASEEQTTLVTDVASTQTPRVVGGQCYGSVPDPQLCRRISVMVKIGNWIYAGGKIDVVANNNGSNPEIGYSNLFRFDAATKELDRSFKPQLFQTAGQVVDSEVTGLAASADGATIYASGKFKTVKSNPGAAAVTRKGVAAFSTSNGAVRTTFNARVCAGGGPCTVSDVRRVGPVLWIGGDFTSVNSTPRGALASVNATTGALTGDVQVSITGRPITNTGTKVTRIRFSSGLTQAVVLGNFNSVAGQTREEVAVVNANPATGAFTGVNSWNAPTLLHAAVTTCKKTTLWPRDADWSPDNSFFVIVGSGGGGGHPYPAPCDAFTRWENNGDPNSVPTGYNHTEIDTILSVCNVGRWSYLGGHFKTLNQERRLDGALVTPPLAQRNETHYGLGVIDTSPTNMLAVTNWNHTDQTGRGDGWGAALCVPGPASSGGGVYLGGDAEGVNGNPQIHRLAYFAPPPG